MDKLTTVVMGKIVSDASKNWKESRDEMYPGSHDVDFTVRVHGNLVIEDDKEITPTASLLNVENMLLILRAAGCTREAAMRAIEEVASEYLVNWIGSDADKASADAARKAKLAEYDPDGKGKSAFDEFKKRLPKIPSHGRVICKGLAIEQVKIGSNEVVEVV